MKSTASSGGAALPTLLSINNHYYRRGGADIVFLEQNRLLEETGCALRNAPPGQY
jgi:hypothetical protein